MSIIVSELFLSACLTPLHCALPQDTPERKHFPQPRPRQPPADPDICPYPTSFFPHLPPLPPPLTRSPHPSTAHVCQSWLVYMGSSSRQKSDGIHPNPPTCAPPLLKIKKKKWKKKTTTNLHVGPTARDPALLTEVGGGGSMTKTTACVEEHCLRLWLEIFSGKNRILYTIVVGVKKGGTY